MDNNSIGEASITPQAIQQVVPEINNPQGQNELFKKVAGAKIAKEGLDYLFSAVADKSNSKFTSRIKNPQTMLQKVAQKRLQGRDYSINNLNDTYGGRFVIKNTKDAQNIKDSLSKLDNLGVINITKKQDNTKDTYHAYHIDFETPTGITGELQIMTPQENLESASNHSLRAIHGEKPEEEIQNVKEANAKIAQKMPNNKANLISQALQNVQAQKGITPIDPNAVAQTMQNMQE